MHYKLDTMNNIIHKREITKAVAEIEKLDRLSAKQLVRKAEISHIRSSGRTVDGKEPKSCGRDVIELGISVS